MDAPNDEGDKKSTIPGTNVSRQHRQLSELENTVYEHGGAKTNQEPGLLPSLIRRDM